MGVPGLPGVQGPAVRRFIFVQSVLQNRRTNNKRLTVPFLCRENPRRTPTSNGSVCGSCRVSPTPQVRLDPLIRFQRDLHVPLCPRTLGPAGCKSHQTRIRHRWNPRSSGSSWTPRPHRGKRFSWSHRIERPAGSEGPTWVTGSEGTQR